MRLPIPWPLPALLTWAAAWATFLTLRAHAAPAFAAFLAATLLGAALSLPAGATRWRRLIIALGFPASLAASGLAGELPSWSWLIPLALLAALYPLNAWRDAPLFPTPTGALVDLARVAPLPAGARVLEAGCGLGAGLRELHRAYPAARLDGLEWSWPLAWLCRWRCRGLAAVRRGDIWAADWSAYHLVYLFQRPESMARAWEKACREMAPGSWLVGLEFEIEGVAAAHRLDGADGRPVWVYRLVDRAAANRRRSPNDKFVSAGPGEMQ